MYRDFLISAIALATYRTPSVKKWSLYENEESIETSEEEGENKLVVSVNFRLGVSHFSVSHF